VIDGPNSAQAVTAKGRVTAKKAVLAVNAFSSQFGITDDYVFPVQTFSLATRPLQGAVAESIGPRRGEAYVDIGDPATERRFNARYLPDGRLLFGNGAVTVPPQGDMLKPRLSAETKAIILDEMKVRYPALTPDDIALWWGGTICRPLGERPLIGDLPGAKSLILAVICNGKGMGLGSSAGRLVVELASPGSVGDADALSFLRYTQPRADVLSTLEGAAFKMLAKTPARLALNTFLRR
jgi:glycine/D-amino acid oxidase-like deaminating enzyme